MVQFFRAHGGQQMSLMTFPNGCGLLWGKGLCRGSVVQGEGCLAASGSIGCGGLCGTVFAAPPRDTALVPPHIGSFKPAGPRCCSCRAYRSVTCLSEMSPEETESHVRLAPRAQNGPSTNLVFCCLISGFFDERARSCTSQTRILEPSR